MSLNKNGINSPLVYITYIPHQSTKTCFFFFLVLGNYIATIYQTQFAGIIGLVAAKANRRVRTVELDAKTLVSCEIEQSPPPLLFLSDPIRSNSSSNRIRLPFNNFGFSR